MQYQYLYITYMNIVSSSVTSGSHFQW